MNQLGELGAELVRECKTKNEINYFDIGTC
jgi:hypothetical protein